MTIYENRKGESYMTAKKKMTEKQEETCENCGYSRSLHSLPFTICKKFVAFPIETDFGYPKKPKNHSPQVFNARELPEDTPSSKDNGEGTFNLSEELERIALKFFANKGYMDSVDLEEYDTAIKEFISRLQEEFNKKTRFGSAEIINIILTHAGDDLSK